jgi:uncharacterized protein YrrD
MLTSLSRLNGSTVTATDGEIGHVREAYFDDDRWAIRYLVIDTGTWLSGRDVLISPYAVRQTLGLAKNIDVSLTQQQVRDSPVTDTHQPVSRRHEREYLSYYAYPEYWGGGDLWAMSALPMLPPPLPTAVESQAERVLRDKDLLPEDVHLRSSAHVSGYNIQATDAGIGHVEDFIFDDESWAVRYLVVDTRNWWPGGKKVLLATRWIDHIDWAENTVYTTLTREQVKNSPAYDEGSPIAREYERQLHDAYGREGYWD